MFAKKYEQEIQRLTVENNSLREKYDSLQASFGEQLKLNKQLQDQLAQHKANVEQKVEEEQQYIEEQTKQSECIDSLSQELQQMQNQVEQCQQLKDKVNELNQQIELQKSIYSIKADRLEKVEQDNEKLQKQVHQQQELIGSLAQQKEIAEKKFNDLYTKSLNNDELKQYMQNSVTNTVQQQFFLKIKGALGKVFYLNDTLKLSEVRQLITLTQENYLMINNKYLINKDSTLCLEDQLPLEKKQAMWYLSVKTKQLTSLYDNKVLDCCGGKVKSGVSVIVWDYHGKDNQKWITE